MTTDTSTVAPNVPCERCGGDATFATQVSSLGDIPGAHVYHCAACNGLTWIRLRGSAADTRAPD